MKNYLTYETYKFGTSSYFKGGFIFSINFKIFIVKTMINSF